MIALTWFRPWMLKAGGLAVIISMIFYAGCHTQKRFDAGKIAKAKAEVETIEANYDQCLEMVVRSEESYKSLEKAVIAASEEAVRLNAEYELKMKALRRTYDAAIENIKRTHKTAMQELVEENTELNERFATMTAAEACDEAMREIVK